MGNNKKQKCWVNIYWFAYCLWLLFVMQLKIWTQDLCCNILWATVPLNIGKLLDQLFSLKRKLYWLLKLETQKVWFTTKTHLILIVSKWKLIWAFIIKIRAHRAEEISISIFLETTPWNLQSNTLVGLTVSLMDYTFIFKKT